jgi:uncharacterized coiled-coil DUF342 family protein
MPIIYKDVEVEVDVDLSDFDDNELVEELERRRVPSDRTGNTAELLHQIYHLRRQGRHYESELDQLIYAVTGRAI